MAKASLAMFTFNRGIVSRLGAARADIKRLALGAKRMKNWVTRALGSMNIRPGLGYIGSTRSDAAARFLPFVFALNDKALVELTNLAARVWVNDVVISRVTVSTAVVNGTFPTNIASWTDDDAGGAVSSWVAPNYMQLVGDGTSMAARTQLIAVAAGDVNKEHALKIIIQRGPVVLKVGTTAGADDYIAETTLDTGYHSLALTPTGSFYIRFQSTLLRAVQISNCTIEAAGDMVLTTPWPTASLGLVRAAPSGDILFCQCKDIQQYKIERRATRSWSVVRYLANDGPFRVANTGPITLTASVVRGNGTLTASMALFTTGNVGGLYTITHAGQQKSASISAADAWTDAITVTGSGAARTLVFDLSGTWVATVTVQRSTSSATGPWVDLTTTYTANTVTSYLDGLDNQTTYYRIGVATAAYTSGTVVAAISVGAGETNGVARITGFTSSTVCDMEVLTEFAAITASAEWSEGLWSTRRGWPSAGCFDDGRLWQVGKDKVVASGSDAFYLFDPHFEGDAGPINRSIGSGPVESINWILPLQRLVVGGEGAEHSCRSTSLDEPLTPSNFNIKPSSTQGSDAVDAIKIDSTGIYVQRGGVRVFELGIDPQTGAYASTQLTAVNPEIGRPGIVRVAAQRQPETRVHFVRSDGTVAMLTFDKNEQVICWSEVDTDGLIEDVVVLPGDTGDEDDHVYYVVQRTINGSTKRYLERWATEAQCRPTSAGALTTSRLGDSYIIYSGVSTFIISGLSHLEGEQVVVWGNGVDLGYNSSDALIYTVSGGQITLAVPVTEAMVGLPYTAEWESTKLLQMPAQLGTPLTKHKTIPGLALVLADTHARGLKFGRNFTTLDDMPSVEESDEVDVNSIWVDYDAETIVFPGDFSTDERLCLQAKAPRPCTVLAAIVDVHMNE